ncbi:hypothetical protein [Reyranella sp.]|uniref:hypothetical protein n=1 Tax=Reyranella sp. TaxID=1929291 RepID=UPI003D0D9CBE
MASIAEQLAATVGRFPPPSLAVVIAELKRERGMRERVYPRLIDNGTLTEEKALFQQRCLEEAIDRLEELLSAERSRTPASPAKGPVRAPAHVNALPPAGDAGVA